jgi:hypothetical protein
MDKNYFTDHCEPAVWAPKSCPKKREQGEKTETGNLMKRMREP